MKVKAISLWEPWASLMRAGAKTIETRSWYTNYRGPLLICASKHWDAGLSSFLECAIVQSSLRSIPEFKQCRCVRSSHLWKGHAVCIVDLIECVSTDGWEDIPYKELAFGDFSSGRFGWITQNLRTFAPFPVRGRQGLFDVELPSDLRWVA
jgi:hypothetical protein